MKMEIAYIEWLPCAGKSFLIKALEQESKHIIHELGRVLDKSEFPWDGKTVQEIKNIDHRFIQKEHERGLNLPEWKTIYFDRSFFTHLTYAYAYSRLLKIPSFQTTVELYQKAIDENKLMVPNLTIDINISSEDSILRQNHKIQANPRKALPWFWRDKDFLNDILDAYISLYKNYTWSLITIDAWFTTEEKLKKVLNFDFTSADWPKLDLEHYLSNLL